MDWNQTLCDALNAAGVTTLQNEPLCQYTSFGIGGPAALLAKPTTQQQLAAALSAAQSAGAPYMLLGRGSNVLFHDDGYHGLVILVGEGLNEIHVEGNTICAGAGAELHALCRAAREAGLAGLEFAYGIPGSVGGAVYMNAGAYGGEMCDVLQSVEYMDEEGKVHTADAASLCLGYRQSVFQTKSWYILSACFLLQKGEIEVIDAKMKDYMQRRRDKQPLDLPSAGSAFKRPPGAFAGALIDECGLRGYRVGGAAISEKHCGFIVNMGGATSADVTKLAEYVVQTVQAQTGYTLEKEVRVISPG